jgi:hypothetical protein
MEIYANTILNVKWWMGVVVVGLVLSLAASYLRTWIDQGLSAVSKRWAERTERSKAERATHVQHLRDHPQQQMYVLGEEMRCRFRGVF